jgi:hypothetical protein
MKMIQRDYSTELGAHELAAEIREFWKRHGHPEVVVTVEVMVRRTTDREPKPVYGIRSNIRPTWIPREQDKLRRVTAFYRTVFHRRLPSGRTSDMINIAKEPYMNERPKTDRALKLAEGADRENDPGQLLRWRLGGDA